MVSLDIPNAYLEVGPLVVTSPTTRCGTTLLQRLISASDNAFVYGEEVGRQLNALTDQFLTVINYVENNQQTLDKNFQNALIGELNAWAPSLAPPSAVMLKAWIETYYQLPSLLAGFGGAIERPIWGFKWPGCPVGSLRAFRLFMPRTRILYLVRHPAETLQSAKARKFVKTAEEAAAFCQSWTSNIEAILALGESPQILMMRYEDLLADREGALARLEAFAGVKGVQRSAFDTKVNTFAGDEADGHSPTQYIDPAPLTPNDLSTIDHRAGEMIRRLYPERVAGARL